jgi:hypothetical protein
MKNRTRAAALAATFALASAGAFARSEVCMDVSDAQIAALFDGWNASLQTGDAKLVVARYAQKSVLLPILSDSPRLTPQAREDYFVHFLARKPVGHIDSRSIEIDCNTAVPPGASRSRSVAK